MSVEASGGRASVGSSDRNGGNNVGDECRIGIDQINEESSDQRFNEQEKKRFDQNEESNDQRFSEEEKKLFVSLEKASGAVNMPSRPADAKPKIQKVPYMLRSKNKFRKYFLPKVFPFGPYYHPSSPYRPHKMAKPIKVDLAADFLKRNGVKKEDLYEDIKKKVKEFKECYDDDLTGYYEDQDHELAWMFLVDGCAILQFIYISVDSREDPETQLRNLEIKPDYAEFLAQDLFLLENQLPYQLLRLIIRHAKRIMPHTKEDEFRTISKEDELLKSIYKFIFYRFRTQEEWNENKDEILVDLKDDHVHLLDLLRKKLIQPFCQIDEKRGLYDLLRKKLIQLFYQIDEKCGLIEIIIDWTIFFFDKLKCNRNEFDRDRAPVSLRNIGKLKEAGINLKLSKTSCLGDIGFKSGTLKLPPITVEESRATLFLNLLGYEMCPDFHNEFEVSSYLYLMDKLIDRTQDVEDLREKNILQNELGSDKEVVELFNEISTHVFPNSKYAKVKMKIDKYYDNKGLIWLRQVSHDIHQYFKGRWSLLAFLAALLALASSIIQTVVTVQLAYQS